MYQWFYAVFKFSQQNSGWHITNFEIFWDFYFNFHKNCLKVNHFCKINNFEVFMKNTGSCLIFIFLERSDSSDFDRPEWLRWDFDWPEWLRWKNTQSGGKLAHQSDSGENSGSHRFTETGVLSVYYVFLYRSKCPTKSQSENIVVCGQYGVRHKILGHFRTGSWQNFRFAIGLLYGVGQKFSVMLYGVIPNFHLRM